MTAARAGRRSRSRSPVQCGCFGDPEGDGARRRRRRTQGRRTVSCGCAADDPADDAEGGSRRYWTGSPPRTPPDWRDSFQRLRRRWSDEARRRCRRRGSQDRARPANPSPGEIRALAGRNTPGAQPEYAASGPDPAPWTPEAQAANEPTLEQRLAELRRWQDATLRVSVEAVGPTSDSRFSLAACWDPDSTPNTFVTSTGSDHASRRDRAKTSAIGPPAAGDHDDGETSGSSSATSSSSGSSSGEDESATEESETEDQSEDPLEQVWDEVDEVLQKKPIDKDEARAEVESILRASELSKGEKLAVINAALEESAKDPDERRVTAKSMLRRATRSPREVTDADDSEREAEDRRSSGGRRSSVGSEFDSLIEEFGLPPRVSSSQDRRASRARQSARRSNVRSLVEEFEAEGTKEPRVSASRRKTESKPKKGILRRDQRRSTEGRQTRRDKNIRWAERSTALLPVESRKSSIRASAFGSEGSSRKSEQRQSEAPRKTGLGQRISSIFGKSFSTAPKSGYREARLAPRPSQRRSSRRSSPWRVDSSVLGKKHSSATGVVSDEDEEPAHWSMEARHGSRGSSIESDDSEADEEKRPSHSGEAGERRSTTKRGSEAPRLSRRSTAARSMYHEDEESPPLRSVSTRRPTGWPRHKSRSSIADNEADQWVCPRSCSGASMRSTTVERGSYDDVPRYSHRKSSRRSTHKEPPETRESRAGSRRATGRVSDIEEDSTEEDRRSSSRSSYLEEGDPVERQRWSSRRRDDEDDEEGGGGGGPRASALSRRHSGRKSSARRSTNVDATQSSQPRKKSNRNGTEEHDSEAYCCCVGGDHSSTPSDRLSAESRPCTCAAEMRSVSDQLTSASDLCCCHGTAVRKAASRAGMGDVSGSEECCCSCHANIGNLSSAIGRDISHDQCTCYCGDVGGSAPELSHAAKDDATVRRDTPGKTTARKEGAKKRDLEVELYCECLGGEDIASPAKEGSTHSRREVCPAAAALVPVPCKAALEEWPEPTCLCDRPLSKKKKKTAPALQQRRSTWLRVLLRYWPWLVAVLLWLLCVWWVCGVLRPLFVTEEPRRDRCAGIYWAPK